MQSILVLSADAKLANHYYADLALAVPQHTHISKNTKSTVKCCYVMHSYVGTILHNSIFPPEN